MASNYVKSGKTLTLTAPYLVAAGAGALVGNIFGVSLEALAAAAAGEFTTEGVWSLAKVSTEVWVVGEKIYWDNTNKRCSNVPTASFNLIGFCTEAAANPTTTGKVKLLGNAARGPEDASKPAAASYSTAGGVTLTAADILGGIVVADPNGAGRTYTLPTAALLVAAVPGAQVGDVLDCLIVNGADAAEAITLAAGSGGGFDANQTASSRVIGQNTSKLLRVRLTNVTASSEAYVAYA